MTSGTGNGATGASIAAVGVLVILFSTSTVAQIAAIIVSGVGHCPRARRPLRGQPEFTVR